MTECTQKYTNRAMYKYTWRRLHIKGKYKHDEEVYGKELVTERSTHGEGYIQKEIHTERGVYKEESL